MAEQYYEGVGRRKASIARVRVLGGSGEFTVNEKPLADFFGRTGDTEVILSPMMDTGTRSQLDVSVLVKGGGVTGQRDAIRMGLARALVKYNPELEAAIREGKHLTRDPRIKERKKPGLKRARKAPTYTKR